MEFSAVIFGDGVDFSRHITRDHSRIPATLSVLAMSASAILTVDSSSLPRAAVRSDPFRPPAAVPRALVRRMRRIRRRSATEDGGEDGFFDGGDGDDGPFGGGSGSGKGWGSWRPGDRSGKNRIGGRGFLRRRILPSMWFMRCFAGLRCRIVLISLLKR
ncbi:hypothetical protein M5K25_013841 [Dendrobium thyrsiflorum]|uniref:Uncharacterized protein n=1 Tax=Dendrobium thyrsiflorum TaxID=117978 RepID=A0ABD0UU24_DENTH